MTHLTSTKWREGVDIFPFCHVLHCLQPYEDVQKMLDSLQLHFYVGEDDLLGLSLNFPVRDCGERRLVQGYRDGPTDWVGINQLTVKNVPFLSALFSENWTNGCLVPSVIYASSASLKLVDYVLASGRDFTTTPIAALPLSLFNLTSNQLMVDLDYLNVEYLEDIVPLLLDFDLEHCFRRAYNFPHEPICQENAEHIAWAIQSRKVNQLLEKLMIKDWIFYFIFEAVRNTSLYGRNLTRLLFFLCKDWVMDDQSERMGIEVTQRKMEQVWFCRFENDNIDNYSKDMTCQLPLDFDFIHEMGVVDHVWLLPGV